MSRTADSTSPTVDYCRAVAGLSALPDTVFAVSDLTVSACHMIIDSILSARTPLAVLLCSEQIGTVLTDLLTGQAESLTD